MHRSFLTLSFLVLFLAACDKEESKKTTKLDLPSSGISKECREEARNASATELDNSLKMDLKMLERQLGNMAQAPIAEGYKPGRVVPREYTTQAPVYPGPTVDVLAELGVTLENEYEGRFGITDEAIRGAADVVYTRLGVADDLEGWTLSFRSTEEGAFTHVDAKKKRAVVSIAPPEFEYSASHELAHVLTGLTMTDETAPRVMMEFVAIAAEPHGKASELFTYERVNVPILGIGKSLDGESGIIHANNSPLDGLRYDLLRTIDDEISDSEQIALAKAIYAQAKKNGEITLGESQQLFEQYGVGDCAIFAQTTEPGLYVDVVWRNDGTPVILAKTIDKTGYEGFSPGGVVQIVYRDESGRAMGAATAPLIPILTDDGLAKMGAYAAVYELRINGEAFQYHLGTPQTMSTGSATTLHSATFTP